MTVKVSIASASLVGMLFLAGCSDGGSAGDNTISQSDLTDSNVNVQTTLEDDASTLQLGAPGICTREGMNAWVDAQMRDYYIFADQVPVVDPSEYENTSALLRDLRVLPDSFSSVSPQATRTALFEEGETFGFGFSFRRDQSGALRFSNIVSGSPLSETDAMRGDRILALNNVPELDITDSLFDEIFGETGVPTAVTFTLERNGETLNIDVTSGIYRINTVSEVSSFTLNGATVGYIESSIFLRTSEAEIDTAVAQLLQANPSEIILDFRHNGGGFVFVAQKFAAQLAGSNFTGEVFQNTTFNEDFSRFNRSSFLEAQELNLNLPRIVVLTAGGTASAAEAIVNNLRPYLDVVVIGSQTAGKPFASVSNPNCDEVLNAMDRITSNNDGETVLGGIAPTCQVFDEFLHPMSSPDDALFGAALTYLSTNACPADQIASTGLQLRANFINAPIDSYQDLDVPTGVMLAE